MDTQLENKLREIVDRHEIWQVMLRYARGIDRFDRELVRSCYFDDAIDDHHAFAGTPDQFLDWALGYHAQAQRLHHHGLSNHTCEIQGDDAYAETYYTFVGENVRPPHLFSIGRYVDHLQRRDGVWKIANRVCTIEKNFDLAEQGGANLATELSGMPPPLHAGRDRNDLSYMRPVSPRRGAATTQ